MMIVEFDFQVDMFESMKVQIISMYLCAVSAQVVHSHSVQTALDASRELFVVVSKEIHSRYSRFTLLQSIGPGESFWVAIEPHHVRRRFLVDQLWIRSHPSTHLRAAHVSKRFLSRYRPIAHSVEEFAYSPAADFLQRIATIQSLRGQGR